MPGQFISGVWQAFSAVKPFQYAYQYCLRTTKLTKLAKEKAHATSVPAGAVPAAWDGYTHHHRLNLLEESNILHLWQFRGMLNRKI
jgi:hypothetical protein